MFYRLTNSGKSLHLCLPSPATARPEIERKLTDVLASIAHLNPLGDRSAALLDAPSHDGIYARANLREDTLDRLDDNETKARLAEALQGTGIDPEAVAARMREGAGNAALERHWLAQDLRSVTEANNLDQAKGGDSEDTLDRLEAVHVRLGDVLTDARILRAVDDVDEADGTETSFADHLTLREHDLADERPDVFASSERQDFQQLVAPFRRTDFDHPFSDDPSVRRAGALEVEEARAAFNAYAQRSPDHTELASMAWDQISDSRKPQAASRRNTPSRRRTARFMPATWILRCAIPTNAWAPSPKIFEDRQRLADDGAIFIHKNRHRAGYRKGLDFWRRNTGLLVRLIKDDRFEIVRLFLTQAYVEPLRIGSEGKVIEFDRHGCRSHFLI
ncbi:hypothetical protein FALB51S_02594 [Frigidibacter albus]|nr:hypothetical protein [Frigidibacter mobilis]